MPYEIERGSYVAAKKLGVIIKPSENPDKKIDVYNHNDEKLASIGASGMMDYWKYLAKDGEKVANEHRRRYKIRHERDRHVYHSNGWFADKILW